MGQTTAQALLKKGGDELRGDTALFTFTCGCSLTDSFRNPISKTCPAHPGSGIREVSAQCEICGAKILFKRSQYRSDSVMLCRKHRAIRECYMNYVGQHRIRGTAGEIVEWDKYVAVFERKNCNRAKGGPRR